MTDDSELIIQMDEPKSEFECAHFDITDEMLEKADIAAYLSDQKVKDGDGKKKPYNEKTVPEKAVYVKIPASKNGGVEIWLDTDTCTWDSSFKFENRPCKLSFDQMKQFFKSEFYRKLTVALSKKWPVSDPTFSRLMDGVVARRMRVGFEDAGSTPNLAEVDMPGKRVDLANCDVTGDGERDYSSTGRKIIKDFGDAGVQGKSGEYYCWPNPNFPYKWSQWKDWKKIKPLCKMYFKYNNRRYMISLSPFEEKGENRGFRGADCDWDPPLAWLTPGECDMIVKLSIVRKFIKRCIQIIRGYVDQDAEDIYERINNKDKITLDEIRQTQSVIKHTVNTALRNEQADTYCFED